MKISKSLKTGFLPGLFILSSTLLFSQTNVPGSSNQQQPNVSQPLVELAVAQKDTRVTLATTTKDYPVTPGDVYILSYNQTAQSISIPLIVNSDYSVNLALFGNVEAENFTFVRFKKLVEKIVKNAYPDSFPSLMIQSTGLFNVYIKGEVKTSRLIPAWGLSRLSNVIDKNLTPYSSIRDIEIISPDGKSGKYDLFSANRYGKLQENPYIKPGDTVVVYKYRRRVTVNGEVRRAGSYQLFNGEELRELLYKYGDGFTPSADITRIGIKRIATGEKKYKLVYINAAKDNIADIKLLDEDIVTVYSRESLQSIVYIEGAVDLTKSVSKDKGPETQSLTYNKIMIPIKKGTKLSVVVEDLQSNLSPVSDIRSAYIVREGESKPLFINLEDILYNYDKEKDIVLKSNDRIVIPFKQFKVTVTGSVINPGRYPYIPDRTYQYYIDIAGGYNPSMHIGNAANIFDVNNTKRSKTAYIQPEDKIIAPINNPFYYVGEISAVTSIIYTSILIINAIINAAKP